MTHWLLDGIDDQRRLILAKVDEHQLHRELLGHTSEIAQADVRRMAEALEMVVLDLLPTADSNRELLRACAADSFRLWRFVSLPEDPTEAGIQLLRQAALGLLGDKGADAARLLRQSKWRELPLEDVNWDKRTWATIVDTWLRLIRKQGWFDRDLVLERVAALRAHQEIYEKGYLDRLDPHRDAAAAFELIGLYHLAKCAEILALFITDGVVEDNHQVQFMLDAHFDFIRDACSNTQLYVLDPLSRLLAGAARQMVENSIWTVTRAVNSRVTQFVQSLINRGRGDKALFEVLPPQRRALAERGLLGSSRRAVVVSLPTSSGKTLIAQFRILQALNQFDREAGWVAYLAPTRALVNQVTRQLRRDFSPLGIAVENVSPALEVDSVEQALLLESNPTQLFRVLVTTPEKLDLLLRQGWEQHIGRPLTLVIVDEAHNLQTQGRGLKLELLLATINNDCKHAQFLLLTPFVKNAGEIARWLGGHSSDDISLAVDWQPNDRTIGVVLYERNTVDGKRRNELIFKTVHTTRRTLVCDASIRIFSSKKKQDGKGKIAAEMARHLCARGPVILMHRSPKDVWLLAKEIKSSTTPSEVLSPEIELVRAFLIQEMGQDFPLVELLTYRIAVHHSGLPEEVRLLVEWLFEQDKLDYMVATTTLAQGVNFPIANVVMASRTYPTNKGSIPMPAEDFWNIAGRAGRVSQGQMGVVALASNSASEKDDIDYIKAQVGALNSTLIDMVLEAGELLSDLGSLVYRKPEWSSFLQYLVHSYLQLGKPKHFTAQIEQVLRGTLGYEQLRLEYHQLADQLVTALRKYAVEFQAPGQPLTLVDSTGFSLQGVKTILNGKGDLNARSWNPDRLFAKNDRTLQDMMGVLLKVPELRSSLEAVSGGRGADGSKLANIVKDWVNGASLPTLANRYFAESADALTECGRELFGRIMQTTSWGLSALMAITTNDLDDEARKRIRNLPARVYYGVNDDDAIALRLLGIPRAAATPMALFLKNSDLGISQLRQLLVELDEQSWVKAMGASGKTYRKVWRILEGLEA